MSPIIIKHFDTPEDINPILIDDLYRLDQQMDYSWTQEQWTETLSSKGYISSVIYLDSTMIGFALSNVCGPDQIHLLKILINLNYRGKGISDKLLESLFVLACTRGQTSCYIDVEVSNIRAINFYVRHDFSRLNIRTKFYTDGKSSLAMLKTFK